MNTRLRLTTSFFSQLLACAVVAAVGIEIGPAASADTNCVTPPSDLVGWWPSDGNTTDWVGENAGILVGGVTFAAGHVGEAFSLDGNSGFVKVPAASALNVGLSNGLTLECWIKPSDLANPQPLVEWNSGSAHGVHLWISQPWFEGQGGPGNVFANLTDTTGSIRGLFSAPGLLTSNSFHHVAVTYDKTSGMGYLYLNGAVVFSANLGIFTPQTSYDLHLGRRPSNDLPAYYGGSLDEVSIYGRALSAAEIQAIHSAGSAGKCSGPVPPYIAAQPTDQTAIQGQVATFAVTAGGTSPLNYQWRFEEGPIEGATNATLTLVDVQFNQAGVYSVLVSNAHGSVTSSNALLTVNPAPAAMLLNVNFAASEQVKVGGAATGLSPTDFWNRYTAPWQESAALGGLKLADGTGTEVGLTVQNGAGHWGFTHPDEMYSGYCYARDFGTITLTLTNLPAGEYDVYLYGHGAADSANTLFQLLAEGADFGHQATTTNADWALTHWVEGAQYVVYRGVMLSNGALPLVAKAHPGRSGYTHLNGLQIVSAAAMPPAILAQPASQTVPVGDDATFTVGAVGTPPLSYQWLFNGNALPAATASAYTRAQAQPADAGVYSVIVSNAYGSVTSSNALLTVNPAPAAMLLNVNFAASEQVKVGGAATGQSPTDFWNRYTAPWQESAALGGLKLADGTGTEVGLTVQNGAGHWGFTHPDEMYSGYCYARDFGTITLTITNLPAGEYDVYLYGHGPADNANTLFQLLVGTEDFGHQATTTSADWALTHWVEDAQYVVYRGVTLSGGGLPLEVKAHPGQSGYTHLNGLQIVSVAAMPPVILAQPANQTISVGDDATFTVTATGTLPLSYQWLFNGNAIPGATASTYTRVEARPADAGVYSVLVTNAGGTALSGNAVLTVNYPPATVRVAGIHAGAGVTVSLPVVLVANGIENAVGFSVNFNPDQLAYVEVALGDDAAGASLLFNASQVASGRLGVMVALPAGETFTSGLRELARVYFTTAILTSETVSAVTFGDQPILRQLSDVSGNVLTANYEAGGVTIAAVDYEGDVTPRPHGDKAVTITDWVLMGRYVARLDYPTNASEFQRADCAPRATLGDGEIKVTDWVQAGRYVAGLDPLTPVGGPAEEISGTPVPQTSPRPGAGHEPVTRQLKTEDLVLAQGQVVTVKVKLEAQGDETALGFSLGFDPEMLSFVSATLGSGAGGTSLNVNTLQSGDGKLGVALTLPTGTSFTAGTKEVVQVTFQVGASATGACGLSFTDQPVPREISDAAANPLPAGYVSSTLVVYPPPTLHIELSGEDITLVWPLWATNFALQTTAGATPASDIWTNVPAVPATGSGENVVTFPLSGDATFYRLRQP